MEIKTTVGQLVDAEPFLRRVSGLPLKSKAEPDGISAVTKNHIVKLSLLVATETRVWHDAQAEIFRELHIEMGRTVAELPRGVWGEYLTHIKEFSDLQVTLAIAPLKSSDLQQALACDIVGLGPLCEFIEPTDKE